MTSLSPTAFRFQPFSKKQKQVLTWWMPRSPYRDYDMIIADGSIRSGKTIAMIDGFLTWSLETFRHQSFILSGRTMGALKRNVLRPAFEILAAKAIPYRYNRSEHFVQIGTNTYYCFGANNEAAQDVLQGLTAAGAYGDEAALFPQSFIEQMIGRCSVEGSKIWLNCNPAGPYHYLKVDYIDKAEEKRILRLHFTLDDNLTLSEQIKERYRRMFTGVFYKRYILGLWVMAEGVVYDMWDEGVHVVGAGDSRGLRGGLRINPPRAQTSTMTPRQIQNCGINPIGQARVVVDCHSAPTDLYCQCTAYGTENGAHQRILGESSR